MLAHSSCFTSYNSFVAVANRTSRVHIIIVRSPTYRDRYVLADLDLSGQVIEAPGSQTYGKSTN